MSTWRGCKNNTDIIAICIDAGTPLKNTDERRWRHGRAKYERVPYGKINLEAANVHERVRVASL